jgi:hypothetical protein
MGDHLLQPSIEVGNDTDKLKVQRGAWSLRGIVHTPLCARISMSGFIYRAFELGLPLC